MGRRGDHADTDLKFALNTGLIFKSPETIFLDKHISKPKIKNYFNFDNFSKNENNYKLGEAEKELIIMVGYPGSGKSTFVSKNLIKNNFESINQDKLGSKKKCLYMCEKLMKEGLNIVIDNTNPSSEIRKLYIDLGKQYNYNVRCFIMNVNEEHAKHNNLFRFLYKNKKKVPELVYRIYNKNYKVPELSEGFKDIVNINADVPNINTDPKYYFFLY
jgi:bifunctional polynucleotide phosphatase/kinase